MINVAAQLYYLFFVNFRFVSAKEEVEKQGEDPGEKIGNRARPLAAAIVSRNNRRQGRIKCQNVLNFWRDINVNDDNQLDLVHGYPKFTTVFIVETWDDGGGDDAAAAADDCFCCCCEYVLVENRFPLIPPRVEIFSVDIFIFM